MKILMLISKNLGLMKFDKNLSLRISQSVKRDYTALPLKKKFRDKQRCTCSLNNFYSL